MSATDIFSANELETIRTFAAALGLTVAEYIRRATLEQIEDKLDLQELREARAEAGNDPETIPWEQVKKNIGL